MMKNTFISWLSPALLTVLVFSFLVPNVAIAADKRELLGSYRNWDALVITHNNDYKTCYMISTPKSTRPNNVNRGDIYATITIRPRVKITDEVNFVFGYPLRASSEATANIGNKRFKMFTEGNGSWLRTPSDDRKMVAAMRAGNNLVVRGRSSRGTNTTDQYSLLGFTAAHNAIKEACKS
jgi:hypothetical protein